MGIPSYFQSILKEYTSIYRHLDKTHIDHLYIDANSIIYDALRTLLNENESIDKTKLLTNIKKEYSILYYKTCSMIQDIILRVSPSFVFIAFDGVVPIAKMKQQKHRRFKTPILDELREFLHSMDLNKHHDNTIQHNNKTDCFHTIEITPGTEFMNGLNLFFKSHKFKDIPDTIDIMFSLSDIEGEGEHKICEYIRNTKDTNITSAFYGLDADLFILALQHNSYRKNIYLIREQPDYDTILSDIYKKHDFVCISISELSKGIVNKINTECHKTTGSLQLNFNRYINDYVFLSFFVGNDFLPHIFGLSLRRGGFDIILDTYKIVKNNRKYISNKDWFITTKDNNINWKFLKEFFNQLNNIEHTLVKDEYKWLSNIDHKIKNKWNSLSVEDKLNNIPSINREKEEYIDVYHKNWNKRYYEQILDTHYSDKTNIIIEKMCWNYFQGLYWVLKYYTGNCDIVNILWMYKYDEAPLIQDIYKQIPTMNINMFNTNDVYSLSSIHPYTQLSFVLPSSYHYLIPSNITNIVYKKYPFLQYTKGVIHTFLKRYFWEGTVHTKYIDISKLNNEILHTLQ